MSQIVVKKNRNHSYQLWTFYVIKSVFVKYLGLLNFSNKVNMDAQTFKHVTSSTFYTLIGPHKDLGGWIHNCITYKAVSQTLPPRVYPESTKRYGEGRGGLEWSWFQGYPPRAPDSPPPPPHTHTHTGTHAYTNRPITLT